MMTLENAINHAEGRAEVCESLADYSDDRITAENYRKCAEEHRQLAEWLKELQRYQWIPIDERLPEYLKTVLLSTFHGVRLGFRDHTDAYGDYWDLIDVDSTTTSQYVYAWMELPEPYQPKGERNE